jgi:hypothetical protein
MTTSLFSVVEAPELYITRERAFALAQTVRSWGYRAAVYDKRDRDERGFAVAVSSNNGFEGYAHAL